jgi:hypothetical protein
MGEVHSKALGQSIEIDRIIGKLSGENEGATIIFTGGIHGNEPSGVFALKQLIDELQPLQDKMNGNIYAISGNLSALQKGERYEKEDLNRLWTKERMMKILDGQENELPDHQDTREQLELFQLISGILENENGPFFFIDLHTTSSDTIPFITVNDSLLNRRFATQFPVPIILGIEEYLDGPLLSYINHLGYLAVGFESGQHDALASIDNHFSFAMLAVEIAGILKSNEIPNYDYHLDQLEVQSETNQNIFEITYRYEIAKEEHFIMNPGFENFIAVHANDDLAQSNDTKVKAPFGGRIFMPLYQAQGNDGFFIIRQTPRLFLYLSTLLRKVRFDNFLVLLPGVKWQSKDKETLIISLKIARFFAKEFLHLLGYRSRELDATHLYAKNRERSARTKEYKHLKWV